MLSVLLLITNTLWGGIVGKDFLKDPERLAVFLGIELMVEGAIYTVLFVR